MRNRFLAASAAFVLLAATSACNEVDDPDTTSAETGENIAGSLSGIDGMDTASSLINHAGLEEMLEGDAAYTLFLPTDKAFAALPEGELDWLHSDEGRPALIALLRQHMVPGTVAQEDLEAALASSGGTVSLANLADTPLALRREGETIIIGGDAAGPQVSLPPHIATNGVVYEVSALIQPES